MRGEDCLTNRLVRDRAVIEKIDRVAQIGETEPEPRRARQECALEHGRIRLFSVCARPLDRRRAQVRALRIDEQPHGPVLVCAQLVETVLDGRLVLAPVARHEDESKHLHARAEDRNPLERVLEDDVECAVHAGRVRRPPHEEPVGIDLVVRDQDDALLKARLNAAVRTELQTRRGCRVTRDNDRRRRKPLDDGDAQHAKLLLRPRNPRIVPCLVVEIERRTENLIDLDNAARTVEVDGEGYHARNLIEYRCLCPVIRHPVTLLVVF